MNQTANCVCECLFFVTFYFNFEQKIDLANIQKTAVNSCLLFSFFFEFCDGDKQDENCMLLFILCHRIRLAYWDARVSVNMCAHGKSAQLRLQSLKTETRNLKFKIKWSDRLLFVSNKLLQESVRHNANLNYIVCDSVAKIPNNRAFFQPAMCCCYCSHNNSQNTLRQLDKFSRRIFCLLL